MNFSQCSINGSSCCYYNFIDILFLLFYCSKIILQFLQTHLDKRNYKARDIAEELFISSRTVSGSLRKLVTDGFVEKMGENPTIYSITNKGKEFKID